MKSTLGTYIFRLAGIILLAFSLLRPDITAAAEVCSQGTGIPPFLQTGVDSNLLLLLDNSGSMLDMAYTDEASQCYDKNFLIDASGNSDTTIQYVGNFDREAWYEWSFGLYPPWQSGTEYGDVGEPSRVYTDGIIYQVDGACTSAGNFLVDDTGCDWETIHEFQFWSNGNSYPAGTILFEENQFYRNSGPCVANDGDASDGTDLQGDTGCSWVPVDSTYHDSDNYSTGDIVSYKGMFFEALSPPPSVGTSPEDDVDGSVWKFLDEGKYVEITAVSNISTHCNAAAGDADYNDNLCISIDSSTTPAKMTQFVAKGNFLNWATASKFDIQKEILTGGKYSYRAKQIISESRGCSGLGFTKEVDLNSEEVLTMRIRGRTTKGDILLWDQVDSSDYTTRIDILGITLGGFDYEKCEAAVVKILEDGLNGTQNLVDSCLEAPAGVDNGDQRAALNHALQYCWQSNYNLGKIYENTGSGAGSCQTVYQSNDPTTISPWYNAYHCFGIYDSSRAHGEREGYVGRCWDQGGGVAGGTDPTCEKKAAVSQTDGGCDGDPCEYGDGITTLFKNDGGYNWECTDIHKGACKKDDDWVLRYEWSPPATGSCSVGELWGGGTATADWSGEIDGNVATPDPDTVSAEDALEADIPTSLGDLASDAEYLCIWQAMEDYCADLTTAEVIDPSEAAGVTTEYGNLPATLIDSGVMSQLGIEHPLAVMKGYVGQPTRPEGVLHKVADKLRIGAMAFNEVGAETECDPAYLTTGVARYCPKENKDGAKLIAGIEKGSVVIDVGDLTYMGGKRHVDDLAERVNAMQATSWTPLAEAMFSALGYYTQNDALCLNKDSAGDCIDFPTDEDPIQSVCQDNHILVITEGESTTDINASVLGFVNNPGVGGYLVGSTPSPSGDSDADSATTCDGLQGSTYFDDMTWWGQHLGPLFKIDSAGNRNVITHVVTTGSLDNDNAGECSPLDLMEAAAENGGTSLYSGGNPADLEKNLYAVLSNILARASSGSAASVISSSRSGSGAAYQAIFWPELTDNESDWIGDNDNNTVTWVGDVHALFISSYGLMYEDTNQDGKLEPSGDLNNNNIIDNDETAGGEDKQVIFYYSKNSGRTRGCYNITDFINNGFVCPDDNDNAVSSCESTDDCVEIMDVKYLWSAAKRLRDTLSADRKIFTWNDFNNDGIVNADNNEWFSLDNDVDWVDLNGRAVASRGLVTADFLTSDDWLNFVDNDSNSDEELEVKSLKVLVQWLRGEDQLNNAKKLRSRQFHMDNETKEWRLGDIIHSTPIVVAKPAEAYQYIYRDSTYTKFYKKWVNRRNMIYFGANDGMLHAVNGGFYSEDLGQFFCTEFLDNDDHGTPVSSGSCGAEPGLGAEMWAYIPYNLQPHLKCLADPDYVHKYYVDHNPRIFDVQIFKPESECAGDDWLTNDACVHAGGWGTILVGSMRFGGSPVLAKDLNGDSDDMREFTSSFFILDITNPEQDPILLGEMTRTTEKDADGNDVYVDLNYTTSSSSMVVMRDGDDTAVRSNWYLAMGNGPTDLDGTNDNDQQGKIAIFPLAWLQGGLDGWGADGIPGYYSAGSKKPFRIPNKPPGVETASGDNAEGGRFLIPRSDTGQPSFVSDMITVDFDVENQAGLSVGAFYRSDAVYFGTTDGTGFSNYSSGGNGTYWNGGGRLFRLVTKKDIISSEEVASKPSEWEEPWFTDNDNNGPIRMLVDVKAPITAAPSVGYDGESFWVYAGTGRFYDPMDKTDDGQPALTTASPAGSTNGKISYFGIREPIDITGNCSDGVLTWDTIDWNINDNNNSQLSPNNTPGERGLMQVDNIIVTEGGGSLDCVYCADDNDDDDEYNHTCSDLNDADCFTSGLASSSNFTDLKEYIAGTGCLDENTSTGLDGWYRDFHEPRERNLGQAALLGGLLTFTGYQPYADICTAEGVSFLYGVQFQTGVAWTENVFGTFNHGGRTIIKDKVSLGRGLASTPSMHVGSGDEGPAKAFIQTTTGEIIEVVQESLPFGSAKSRRTGWTDRCE